MLSRNNRMLRICQDTQDACVMVGSARAWLWKTLFFIFHVEYNSNANLTYNRVPRLFELQIHIDKEME